MTVHRARGPRRWSPPPDAKKLEEWARQRDALAGVVERAGEQLTLELEQEPAPRS